MILGTAAYMSPEQARGLAVDARTDIWAFGCVLYESLTGRKAFRGDTIADCIAAILSHEPDWAALPSTTPSDVIELLQRCLVKDSTRRLQNIADARHTLVDNLASPSAQGHGAPLSVARHATAAWVASLAGIVVAAFIGVRADSPDERDDSGARDGAPEGRVYRAESFL